MHTHDLIIIGGIALFFVLGFILAYRYGRNAGRVAELNRITDNREALAVDTLRQVIQAQREQEHQLAEALKLTYAELGNMENRRATEAKQVWDRITADPEGMIDRLCDEITQRRVQEDNLSRKDWHLLVKPLCYLLRLRTPEEAAHSLWLLLRAVRCYNYDARTSTELEKIVQAALNKLRAST